MDEATRLELELNRISALIALGEIGRADEVLGQFGEIQDSRFNLRRALVSYFRNDQAVSERFVDRVEGADLNANELSWFLMLQGLLDPR